MYVSTSLHGSVTNYLIKLTDQEVKLNLFIIQ